MNASPTDALLAAADTALRTLFATPHPVHPMPQARTPDGDMSEQDKALSASLMRVNHVGEVCAQALYTAQALTTPSATLRAQFTRACVEETDHLAWTQQRLDALGARPSLLNPLWYAGAFGLGLIAGRLGNAVSLGFVVETERQVEAQLEGHLTRLPEADQTSRAIVAQMMADEVRHAKEAQSAGAAELPRVVKSLMKAAAGVMTRTAHHI
jgi:ubiquinone biosynthesis monooxygenase Coq7